MKPQEAPLSDSAINQILEGLDASKLGEWEREFFVSVKTYWQKNKRLSPKQSKRLAEMWKKAHEPKA
jgi:hypothetical protein